MNLRHQTTELRTRGPLFVTRVGRVRHLERPRELSAPGKEVQPQTAPFSHFANRLSSFRNDGLTAW
jgi:hypothetical protein